MMPPSACPPWQTDTPGQTAGERNESARSYTTLGDTIFLSLRLPALARSFDAVRLAPVPGYQWLHTERIPGISLPWAVWLKVMPGPPGGATVVGVESAYLAGAPPKGGTPESFRFIVEQTRRLNRLYGLPGRSQT